MFQGDPTISNSVNSSKPKLLGMEAQSILKSIRTEHSKMLQSKSIARSDLHYFRARHNYYRLSLMRLEPHEREGLEGVLQEFRSKISEIEALTIDGPMETVHTPFLAPVETSEPELKKPDPASDRITSTSQPKTQPVVEQPSSSPAFVEMKVSSNTLSEALVDEFVSELSLLQLALKAEASNQNNAICSAAVERVVQKLKSLKSY